MKSLLLAAYRVKAYQLSGPSWMETERFDIVAKIPEGASKDDVRLMLQNLLAERFKLTLHRDRKEMTTWSLAVGKNGVKMQASPDVSHPRIVTTTTPGKTRIAFTAQSLEQLAKELGNQFGAPRGRYDRAGRQLRFHLGICAERHTRHWAGCRSRRRAEPLHGAAGAVRAETGTEQEPLLKY